ncbi:hypothetical protein Q4Q35_16955 [Flavivirga aquimarina]|uniref:Uncharacterized protein n=1 Tax=Flavivirga aquimarina TaxID=2027862 RepID=A0ABT8WEM9_9FLAO|nr:hypothetical protein [Flavivirga aquimarina]MDO5971498.1 hypothetical protein [Flavivirga aquimarina]
MKNKLTLIISNFLFMLCISLLYTNKTFAQEHGIYELVKNEVSQKKSNTNKDRSDFYNLSKKLHATHYFEQNKLKHRYGESAPVKISLESMNSFSLLNQNNSNYKGVKLITITLKNESELDTPIDLSNIEGFPKLQYIYIKCLFKCTANQIERFVKAPNDRIRIFYISVRPS